MNDSHVFRRIREAATIRFSRTGPRRSVCRRSPRIGPSISCRPTSARLRSNSPRSRRSRSNPAAPTFDNTIDRAGGQRPDAAATVDDVFGNLVGTDTNDALLEIEREHRRRRVAAHWSSDPHERGAVRPHRRALHAARDTLGLDAEQARVLERYHTRFARQGAALDATSKKRLAEITERLATLGTAFSQNVLADEQAYVLVLEAEDDLAGLPDFVRAAARAAAEERGHARQARDHACSAPASSRSCSSRRGATCARRRSAPGPRAATTAARPTTRRSSPRSCALRAERAQAAGLSRRFAHYRLDDAMAKTPEAVRGLLRRSGRRRASARSPTATPCRSWSREEGGNFKLAPWDWRYYAEKVRKARCDIDEARGQAVHAARQRDRGGVRRAPTGCSG